MFCSLLQTMDVSYPVVFVIQVIGCHILLNCVLPLFLISVSSMYGQ